MFASANYMSEEIFDVVNEHDEVIVRPVLGLQ
jgi:hypothetical protein